jgi:hypothetical protein
MALLLVTLLTATASAAPTPAPSPCQPWGDETTEGADLWAEVAARVPTFAGVYVNEDSRTLHVLLTDQGRSLEAAVHALQTIVRSEEFCEFTSVAEPASYNYSQLKAWDDRLAGVMSIPRINSSGIDEVGNRLEVGVEDPAIQGPLVEARWADLRIPREVVNIVQRGPVEVFLDDPSPWGLLQIGIGLVLAVGVFVVVFARRRRKRSGKDGREVFVSGEGG